MSVDSIIKLAGSGMTGSSDSVVSIDMPEDGEIIAISGTISDDTMVIAERVRIEISFLSTSQFNSNDARGAIFMMSLGSITTTGGSSAHANHAVSFGGDGIPINAGERIHMHASITGSPAAEAEVLLYIKLKGGARRSTRRR